MKVSYKERCELIEFLLDLVGEAISVEQKLRAVKSFNDLKFQQFHKQDCYMGQFSVHTQEFIKEVRANESSS